MSMTNPIRAEEGRWRNFGQVSTHRSFTLLACGAIAGLMLAGYALFTARGTSTLIVPPEDVALVNEQPISRSDYLSQLQTLYDVDLQHATLAQRRKVLDDLIREELFVQRGKELDVASTDPEVRAAMVNSVEMEIAADAITAQPSETQLHAFYAAHQGRYTSEGSMTVRDWVFPSSDRMPRPKRPRRSGLQRSPPRLQHRSSWSAGMPRTRAKLPARNSILRQRFIWRATVRGGPQFVRRRGLRSHPTGERNPRPLHAQEQKAAAFDFAAARDRVLNDCRNDAIGHLRLGDEAFLRKRANVLIADDVR